MNYQDFFTAPDTAQHFSEIDYLLRSGTYLQHEHPDHRLLVNFLEEADNLVTLQAYYRDLFGLQLKHQYEAERRFYYLAPTELSSARLPPAVRQSLKPELVIAGLLLTQLVNVDLETPDTVDSLMSLLRVEYVPYLDGLLKHVASLKHSKNFATERDENRVRKWLTDSIETFAQLGWVYKQSDGTFRIMPAMEHLRTLYRDEILKMEETFGPSPA
ncbi:hypothetical protein GCM10028822_00100 [Hymenobacter terrigena]